MRAVVIRVLVAVLAALADNVVAAALGVIRAQAARVAPVLLLALPGPAAVAAVAVAILTAAV